MKWAPQPQCVQDSPRRAGGRQMGTGETAVHLAASPWMRRDSVAGVASRRFRGQSSPFLHPGSAEDSRGKLLGDLRASKKRPLVILCAGAGGWRPTLWVSLFAPFEEPRLTVQEERRRQQGSEIAWEECPGITGRTPSSDGTAASSQTSPTTNAAPDFRSPTTLSLALPINA